MAIISIVCTLFVILLAYASKVMLGWEMLMIACTFISLKLSVSRQTRVKQISVFLMMYDIMLLFRYVLINVLTDAGYISAFTHIESFFGLTSITLLSLYTFYLFTVVVHIVKEALNECKSYNDIYKNNKLVNVKNMVTLSVLFYTIYILSTAKAYAFEGMEFNVVVSTIPLILVVTACNMYIAGSCNNKKEELLAEVEVKDGSVVENLHTLYGEEKGEMSDEQNEI